MDIHPNARLFAPGNIHAQVRHLGSHLAGVFKDLLNVISLSDPFELAESLHRVWDISSILVFKNSSHLQEVPAKGLLREILTKMEIRMKREILSKGKS